MFDYTFTGGRPHCDGKRFEWFAVGLFVGADGRPTL